MSICSRIVLFGASVWIAVRTAPMAAVTFSTASGLRWSRCALAVFWTCRQRWVACRAERERNQRRFTSPALLVENPAEAACGVVSGSNGPEYKAGLADDLFLREIAPGASVVAVHRVVAEGKVMVGADNELGCFIGKQRRDARLPVLAGDKSVHVPGIAILKWRLFRIESINEFKVRR